MPATRTIGNRRLPIHEPLLHINENQRTATVHTSNYLSRYAVGGKVGIPVDDPAITLHDRPNPLAQLRGVQRLPVRLVVNRVQLHLLGVEERGKTARQRRLAAAAGANNCNPPRRSGGNRWLLHRAEYGGNAKCLPWLCVLTDVTTSKNPTVSAYTHPVVAESDSGARPAVTRGVAQRSTW